MATEFRSTYGWIDWDCDARDVESVDDPSPPDGDDWKLVSTAIGALRFSKQLIIWNWSIERASRER